MRSDFWRGRRILLTGHTGFKGAWMSVVLSRLGADVTAFSLEPRTKPNLWELIGKRVGITAKIADLRDASAVSKICRSARPEIAIHMAAQAQVREGYRDPVETFSTNIMGTINLLEALRTASGLQAALVVTSDKVYANPETGRPFAESAPIGGRDPYSASKAATEIVVGSYLKSFFAPLGIPLATARAGNVIGGGDFSSDRLVPDLYRSARSGTAVELRYPNARRPWQHVLDCLNGYLTYAKYLFDRGIADPASLNFGPIADESITVAEVAKAVSEKLGNMKRWRQAQDSIHLEDNDLRLDSTLAIATLKWRPQLDVHAAIAWTAQWYLDFASGKDALDLMHAQIDSYAK